MTDKNGGMGRQRRSRGKLCQLSSTHVGANVETQSFAPSEISFYKSSWQSKPKVAIVHWHLYVKLLLRRRTIGENSAQNR